MTPYHKARALGVCVYSKCEAPAHVKSGRKTVYCTKHRKQSIQRYYHYTPKTKAKMQP